MDNWKEYKIPSHHVISVKLDPETGGVTAIVDIERVVKSIRQETIKRVMEVRPVEKTEEMFRKELMVEESDWTYGHARGHKKALQEWTDNINKLTIKEE